MKKLNIRIIILTLFAIASIGSYTYMNHISQVQQPTPLYSPAEEEEMQEKEIFLPDVELMNKIIEAGKRLSAFSL